LKQNDLRTTSGLERPSEDLAMGGGMSGGGDAEFDEGVMAGGMPVD